MSHIDVVRRGPHFKALLLMGDFVVCSAEGFSEPAAVINLHFAMQKVHDAQHETVMVKLQSYHKKETP